MSATLRSFALLPSAFWLLASWQAPDGTLLPFRTADEVTAYLREARPVKVEEKKLGGVTGARKLLVERDGVRAHAVFRSFHRVYHKTQWENGRYTPFVRDSYRNEIAAYELSRLLGLDRVPPTVPWRMGSHSGALQLWIENGEPGYNPKEERRPSDPDRWRDERDAMRAFDALIENVDRNVGNMLIGPDGRVWWIDHTRSFGRQRTVNPDSIRRCERGFYDRLKTADPKQISEKLSPYIDRAEIEALLARRRRLIALIEKRIAAEGEGAVLFELNGTR